MADAVGTGENGIGAGGTGAGGTGAVETKEVALLRTWLKRARESQLSHHAASELYSACHLFIGIPAAIFSAIVGTTIFSALSSSTEIDIWLKFLVGFISIVAAILTACQTFLRFSERADAHKSAAFQFAQLRRRIEQELSFPNAITAPRADEIRIAFDVATEAAPNVSSAIWRRAVAAAGSVYFIPGLAKA